MVVKTANYLMVSKSLHMSDFFLSINIVGDMKIEDEC